MGLNRFVTLPCARPNPTDRTPSAVAVRNNNANNNNRTRMRVGDQA
jgi:hypothetical protein